MDHDRIVLNEVGDMVKRIWLAQPEHYPGIVLDAFVVMPEHIHGIVIEVDPRILASQRPGPVLGPAPTGEAEVTLPSDRATTSSAEDSPEISRPIDLRLLMQDFKSLTSNKYYEIRQRYPNSRLPDKLWQRSYYERVFRSERDFDQKRGYIVTNPQRRFLRTTQHAK
jgi:REP element-mobilizing transposase RayT